MGFFDSSNNLKNDMAKENHILSNIRVNDYIVFWADTSFTDNAIYEPLHIGQVVKCQGATRGLFFHKDAVITMKDIIDHQIYYIEIEPNIEPNNFKCWSKSGFYGNGHIEKVDKLRLMEVLKQKEGIVDFQRKTEELQRMEAQRKANYMRERARQNEFISNDDIDRLVRSIQNKTK